MTKRSLDNEVAVGRPKKVKLAHKMLDSILAGQLGALESSQKQLCCQKLCYSFQLDASNSSCVELLEQNDGLKKTYGKEDGSKRLEVFPLLDVIRPMILGYLREDEESIHHLSCVSMDLRKSLPRKVLPLGARALTTVFEYLDSKDLCHFGMVSKLCRRDRDRFVRTMHLTPHSLNVEDFCLFGPFCNYKNLQKLVCTDASQRGSCLVDYEGIYLIENKKMSELVLDNSSLIVSHLNWDYPLDMPVGSDDTDDGWEIDHTYQMLEEHRKSMEPFLCGVRHSLEKLSVKGTRVSWLMAGKFEFEDYEETLSDEVVMEFVLNAPKLKYLRSDLSKESIAILQAELASQNRTIGFS
jgi:hypothetical protein